VRSSLNQEQDKKPLQKSTISANATSQATAHSQGGIAISSANSSGSISVGGTVKGSADTNQVGSSSQKTERGVTVSRTIRVEDDEKISIITVVSKREEITIRDSSIDGVEVRIRNRHRIAEGQDEKTYRADSIAAFQTEHPKIYPLIEKYLNGKHDQAVPNSASNDAKQLLRKQLQKMLDDNADNPQIQSAIRKMIEQAGE